MNTQTIALPANDNILAILNFNKNYTGTLNVIVKNPTIRSAEFPWLVDRAAKLLDWYEHGNYNQIVNS